MKVKCPNCKKVFFETTDKYDPDVSPRGDMLRCLLPYHIDYLLSSVTTVAYLTCPECLAQLAPSGKLTVLPEPPEEQTKAEEPKPAFICEVCGKELKTAGALAMHKKTHKEA